MTVYLPTPTLDPPPAPGVWSVLLGGPTHGQYVPVAPFLRAAYRRVPGFAHAAERVVCVRLRPGALPFRTPAPGVVAGRPLLLKTTYNRRLLVRWYDDPRGLVLFRWMLGGFA